MNKKKILLFGSTSYVGYFLKNYLKKFYDVETFEDLSNEKINFEVKDLKSLIPEFYKYNIIINLIHDHSNNIKINLHIIDLILREIKDKQKLIFFSSSQIIEGNSSKYTLVKREIEELIKNRNANYIILRPSLMIDEKIYTRKTKQQFLITLIDIIKKYNIAIMLANGKFYLNIISVFDVFKIIENIINKDLKNKIISIYNHKSLTFIEIIKIIQSEFNIKIYKILIPMFLLKFLSKCSKKIIPDENLKALKFKPTQFSSIDNNDIKFYITQNNSDIIKKLFQSL